MKLEKTNGHGMKHAGWNDYHVNNFLKQYSKFLYMNAGIKDDAKDVINKLKHEGNNIIIITSRSEKHFANPYEVSTEWLEKHGIEYDKLVVEGNDKAKECMEYKIDVLIDDQVGFLQDVSNNTNTKVIMFDSPYNKECNEFLRVYSWKEVYDEIKKL